MNNTDTIHTLYSNVIKISDINKSLKLCNRSNSTKDVLQFQRLYNFTLVARF